MKQQITTEQYKGLNGKSAAKWVEWCLFKNYDFSQLPNIGQMVEFLDENSKTDWSIHCGKKVLFYVRADRNGLSGRTPDNRKGELCDALWEAVKEELEK